MLLLRRSLCVCVLRECWFDEVLELGVKVACLCDDAAACCDKPEFRACTTPFSSSSDSIRFFLDHHCYI